MFPDTPAEAGELEQGDLIVAVDGESIAGVPSDVSTAEIKGPPGPRSSSGSSRPAAASLGT